MEIEMLVGKAYGSSPAEIRAYFKRWYPKAVVFTDIVECPEYKDMWAMKIDIEGESRAQSITGPAASITGHGQLTREAIDAQIAAFGGLKELSHD